MSRFDERSVCRVVTLSAMDLLRDLVAAARKDGWARGVLPLSALQRGARWAELGEPAPRTLGDLFPVGNRPGGGFIELLEPVDQGSAPKRSLSAVFGTGAQPLHTDGAHLLTPPDIVVLSAAAPSPVATLVSRHDYVASGPELRDALAHGLFTVDDGRERFLAPAWSMPRFRFDPGCMTPADARARRVVDYFSKARQTATAIEWTEPDQVLVIDNQSVLHAREDAGRDADRQLHRLMLRIEKRKTQP